MGNTCSILGPGGSIAPPYSHAAGLPAPVWGVHPRMSVEALRMAVWLSERHWGCDPPLEPPVAAVPRKEFQRGTGVRCSQPPVQARYGPGGSFWCPSPPCAQQALRRALRGCEDTPGGSPTQQEWMNRGARPRGPDQPGERRDSLWPVVVIVPAPGSHRGACWSGVSPRRARRWCSVGWRPLGSPPSRGC